ncbi:hypothetical protein H1230_12275 [Paenibacillus sp. 19GGS1-52]|uniref:hypothetical protein n=1 Tax=Paenibacillus sp. 19GGS1-52 TaxID=2758563 RepID=UPI001EFA8DF5|nr:hypothetical protein [Paenibacillus sp. 19GGS1-52]ULO09478.1 hypothetical protein H1230_12275 [Paenibacillus sp. 19GGS1-52]
MIDGIIKLPTPELLRHRMQVLAVLDLILCEEEWLRVHRYVPQGSDEHSLGSLDNGAGDNLFIIFAPEGVIIKGFDHESPFSPHAQEEYGIWPEMYDGVPSSLLSILDNEAFDKEEVTFCLWREASDSVWRSAEIERPQGWEDGTDFLLGYLQETPEQYIDWAKNYYEMPMDLETVQRIYAGAVITEQMIHKLNPDRDVPSARDELAGLGIGMG